MTKAGHGSKHQIASFAKIFLFVFCFVFCFITSVSVLWHCLKKQMKVIRGKVCKFPQSDTISNKTDFFFLI